MRCVLTISTNPRLDQALERVDKQRKRARTQGPIYVPTVPLSYDLIGLEGELLFNVEYDEQFALDDTIVDFYYAGVSELDELDLEADPRCYLIEMHIDGIVIPNEMLEHTFMRQLIGNKVTFHFVEHCVPEPAVLEQDYEQYGMEQVR